LSLIDEISNTVLILIRAGAVCRIAYCFLRLVTAEEEAVQYKKRIRNTVIFYLLAESAFILKDVFLTYFS
jgi:hypothetical protein